ALDSHETLRWTDLPRLPNEKARKRRPAFAGSGLLASGLYPPVQRPAIPRQSLVLIAPMLLTSSAALPSRGNTTVRLQRRHFSSTPPVTKRARRLPQEQRISYRLRVGAWPQ